MNQVDSSHFVWHRRAGLMLAIRYLKSHPVPVFEEPLSDLPQLSKGMIRFALRLFPNFLDRADLTFPVIIAGRGWYRSLSTGGIGSRKRSGTASPAYTPCAYRGGTPSSSSAPGSTRSNGSRSFYGRSSERPDTAGEFTLCPARTRAGPYPEVRSGRGSLAATS